MELGLALLAVSLLTMSMNCINGSNKVDKSSTDCTCDGKGTFIVDDKLYFEHDLLHWLYADSV